MQVIDVQLLIKHQKKRDVKAGKTNDKEYWRNYDKDMDESKKNIIDKLVEESVKKVLKEADDSINVSNSDFFLNDNDWDKQWKNIGKLPNDYDEDLDDDEAIDMLARTNHGNNGMYDYLPARKQAEIDASWAASDDKDYMDVNHQHEMADDEYLNNGDDEISDFNFRNENRKSSKRRVN